MYARGTRQAIIDDKIHHSLRDKITHIGRISPSQLITPDSQSVGRDSQEKLQKCFVWDYYDIF